MLWIIIIILVVVIDQVSKYIVVKNIAINQMIPVIDHFFYLTLHKNTGGAWGIMQNGRLFFMIVIPLISIAVVYFMVKSNSRFLRITLSLILGGAVGNYIDRLFAGSVTDFLLFYIGSYPFPIFNAADMAVTCGTILLAVYMLFIYKEPPKKNQDKVNDAGELKGDLKDAE
jgi:signal peptidase II